MPVENAICWIALTFSALAALATYRAERRLYGGLGMSTLIAGAIVLYNLVNPAFYLITPLLTPMFSMYVGFAQPVSFFLPNIVATAVFLISLAAATRFVRRIPRAVVEPRPIRARNLQLLLGAAGILFATGLIFYAIRNQIAYGSWIGSFSADYTGATARPQVPVFSAYINLWGWAIQIFAVVCLWQHAAGRAGRLAVALPVLVGGLFAVIEGNRGLVATVVLIFVGWFGLGTRITGKRIAGALLVLTLLTLMANARYHKGETSLANRVANIFEPDYFRPFWSSDPVGPALVASYECGTTTEGITFGGTYLRNLAAMIPAVFWPGRPDDSATQFAAWYERRQGLEYAKGTGYAYNSIAEACVNFSYFGAALLGLLLGTAASRLTRWSATRRDLVGRAIFAFAVALAILPVARGSIMAFLAPLMLLNCLLIASIVRACSEQPRRLAA
jgi:oligosaccharide repeat unit polymerase